MFTTMRRFSPKFGPDMAPQAQMPFMQVTQGQAAQGDDGNDAISAAMTKMGQALAARSDGAQWQGALKKSRTNPDAPIPVEPGGPPGMNPNTPPMMPRRPVGFNSMQQQQIGGSIGY